MKQIQSTCTVYCILVFPSLLKGKVINITVCFCVYLCRSAHLLSRYRPRAPIIAVTRNAQTARQAHLWRGIFPVLYTKPAHDVWAEDVDMRVNFAMDMGLFSICFLLTDTSK